VDVPYYLSKYDPDPLRFYLTATAQKLHEYLGYEGQLFGT
jgi:hypothetical protein